MEREGDMSEDTARQETGAVPPVGYTPGDTYEGERGAADTARHVAATAVEETKGVASTAADQARAVAQDAGGHARQLVDEARLQLRAQADDQSRRLAGTLGDVGRQLRSMSEKADDPDSAVTRFTGQVAESAERLASRVEGGGLDRIADDVKRFARNQPGMFLLGALAAGFVVGRLFKAADMAEVAKGDDGGQPATGDQSSSADSDAAEWPTPAKPAEYAELAPMNPIPPTGPPYPPPEVQSAPSEHTGRPEWDR
jgi:hypothetical protein